MWFINALFLSKDTVLAFKQRNKLGRFSDEASEASDASERVQEQASKVISIGDRCEIQLTEDAAMRKRGCVRFIGTYFSLQVIPFPQLTCCTNAK